MKTRYTFEQFIEYGKNNSANIVDGMPWSFQFYGHPVTHENNDLYLITSTYPPIRFSRGEIIEVVGDKLVVN